MPDYRLFCLDGSSHVAEGEWFDACSDNEAIVIVRAKKLRVKCEIWQGSRLVAEIPAYAGDSVSGSS